MKLQPFGNRVAIEIVDSEENVGGIIVATPKEKSNKGDMSSIKNCLTIAKENGSTYIVVGRSITGASDPVAAYKKCVKEFC